MCPAVARRGWCVIAIVDTLGVLCLLVQFADVAELCSICERGARIGELGEMSVEMPSEGPHSGSKSR
jgi:hypothetical protein